MIALLTGSEPTRKLDYQIGLSRLKEAVISSHFMEAIAGDPDIRLYDRDNLIDRSLTVEEATIDGLLIPTLVDAARRFGEERGLLAADRARKNFQLYDLASPGDVGEAEVITEAMFDRQLSRKAGTTCSRSVIRDRIQAQLERDRTLEMALPALPFKIKSPLKTRGDLADLAEVGFILSLFEIALAVEVASGRAAPHAGKLKVRFVVVSDGARFASLANVPMETIARYHQSLETWISRLGLSHYVVIEDYRELLLQHLPASMLSEKHKIAQAARQTYAEVLGPVFDPCAMERTFAASRTIEPDPEMANAEGRFGSLLRSLVYTIDYRTLQALDLPPAARSGLYRELTSALFEPFDDSVFLLGNPISKERLRRAMLAEVWQAAIDYMAEIKSDRDLDVDPVLACLPGAIRWTIHAKAGQFAIATPSVGGIIVQPWAGAAVFRPTQKGEIRLCSFPVLGLEGAQAIPVFVSPPGGDPASQPLFYIDRRLGIDSVEAFLGELGRGLTRRRLK